jgi:hypothetical protein
MSVGKSISHDMNEGSHWLVVCYVVNESDVHVKKCCNDLDFMSRTK